MFLGPVITSAGITIPTYDQILTYYKDQYRLIYGADTYLEADSQDGQLLAIFAAGINDCNQGAVSVFNSFSPTTAQGAGLSSLVKLNGLSRHVASRSTVVVNIVGQVGTIIVNGQIGDNLGNRWNLPASVVIPIGGTIAVTATAVVDGDIKSPAHSVTRIITPTRGWQTVDNPSAAIPGEPVESDATLRQRQAISTSTPATATVRSILAGLAGLSGVQRCFVYENPTGAPDANGIPAHSISAVVEGGDLIEIANTIFIRKTPGTGTYGSTTETVTDGAGISTDINFYVLDIQEIDVEITIDALSGYLSTTGDALVQATIDYVNSIPIGADVEHNKLFTPANLYNGVLSTTYKVTSIELALHGDPLGTLDLTIPFNAAAHLILANVSLVVT